MTTNHISSDIRKGRIFSLLIFMLAALPYVLVSQADIAINDVIVTGTGTTNDSVRVRMQIVNLSAVPAGLIIPFANVRDAVTDDFLGSLGGDPIRNFSGGDTLWISFRSWVQDGARSMVDAIRINLGASADGDPDESNNFWSLVHDLSNSCITLNEAQEAFLSLFSSSGLPESAALFFFPELLNANETVSSFDEKTKEVIRTAAWFAMWVESPWARFEKPVKYLFLDCNTGEIASIDANWFPIINDVPWNPSIYSSSKLKGDTPNRLDTVFSKSEGSFTKSKPDSVCALLITGTDPNDTMQNAFRNDVEFMTRNLAEARSGPHLDSDQIIVRENVSPTELSEEIQKLQSGYNKIYFYFTGHGTEDGNMATGSSTTDLVSYTSLFEELLTSEAKDLCVMIDNCYSGRAIEDFENLREKLEKDGSILPVNVEIFTSSHPDSVSYSIPLGVDLNQGAGHYSTGVHSGFYAEDADFNKDSCITFEEAHTYARSQNWMHLNEFQMPQKHIYPGYDIANAGESIIPELTSRFGESTMRKSDVYFYPVSNEVKILSFDEAFELDLDSSQFFGWIDTLPNAYFGKSVIYFTYQISSSGITIYSDIDFWPTFPDNPEIDPFDDSYLLHEADLETDLDGPPDNIIDSSFFSNTAEEKICAILISGLDSITRVQHSFTNNVADVKENLMYESAGPRLGPDQIIVGKGSSLDSILAFISNASGYDKIYFYYNGHATRDGLMIIGDSISQTLDYILLYRALVLQNAKEYCLMFDCCYSGLAISALDSVPEFKKKKVTIVTSSDAKKVSYGIITGINGVDSYGMFTANFMKCFGDPEAENDDTEGISLKESYEWLLQENPARPDGTKLLSSQNPQFFINRHIEQDIGDTPTELNLPGVDASLEIDSRQRAIPHLESIIQLLYNPQDLNASDSVLSSSINRSWNLDGTLSEGDNLTVSLTIDLNAAIDVTDMSSGVLGIITREDPLQNWDVHYPFQYNEAENTITAFDVPLNSSWAVAQVVGNPTSLADYQVVEHIQITPNPASDQISVVFNYDQSKNVEMQLVDLNGITRKQWSDLSWPASRGEERLDLANIAKGVYFLVAKSDSGKFISKPFIKI